MCSNLKEFIELHPGIDDPPSRDRRAMTVYFTAAEHENINRALADSRMWHVYKGKQSQLVRHALANYLPGLVSLLDENYRPMAELMRADIERAGLGQTIEQINEYFSTRGRELLMLMDIGEVDRAFEHYEHVLEFVHAREGVWAGLLVKMLGEHPEMMSWRDSVRRMGVAQEQRLRLAEEAYA